eukprot:gb/GECG01000593.1/.p1 GENE.gb/GECG01000593.1/~~gb/GECG01000593.1/.p1  ORF type:complete len:303 (+),score=32.45 gb/GECG01000593.1/:1-909(+)
MNMGALSHSFTGYAFHWVCVSMMLTNSLLSPVVSLTQRATTGLIEYTNFTKVGYNEWKVPPGVTEVDVFLVGGGGGSGSRAGAGGGYTSTFLRVPVIDLEMIPIIVGAGGNGSCGSGVEDGGYSRFLSDQYRANGGEAPPHVWTSSYHGGNGGSGGAAGVGGTGSGGESKNATGGTNGSDGTDFVPHFPGGKGQHRTTRAFGESSGMLFAGGGGGAGFALCLGHGGDGGGGNANENGVPNTGGGGGGTSQAWVKDLGLIDSCKCGNGGSGGSGIVILRYAHLQLQWARRSVRTGRPENLSHV